MSLTDRAKQLLGGDVDAFEKALEGLKSAKSLEDIKQLLRESSRRLDSLQDRVRREEERLGQLVKEAEIQSRQILQDARNEASKLVKEAEKLRGDYLQKLHEVEAREKAVEWMKESEAALKKREQDLARSEKEVDKAKSEASAKQAFYSSKLDELTTWEQALAKWDATARENGLKESLKPVSKAEKKGK